MHARDLVTGDATSSPPPPNGAPTDRRLGRWSAWTVALLALFHAVAVVLGFVERGDVVRPLRTPTSPWPSCSSS